MIVGTHRDSRFFQTILRIGLAVFVIASPSIAAAQSVITSEITHVSLEVTQQPGNGLLLTATVAGEHGGAVPGGTLQFIDETSMAVLGWADVARPSIVVGELAPGEHRIRADYSGSMNYLPLLLQPSRSAVSVQTMRAAPALTVSSSDSSEAPGALITLTAVVSSQNGTPMGSVTFRDGRQVLAAHVRLDHAGTASFTTSVLADGPRAIVADYDGDASHAPATSRLLPLDSGASRFRNSQPLDVN